MRQKIAEELRRRQATSSWKDGDASLSLQVPTYVLEDLAHDRAQEEQGNDHDDGNQGEEQTVLNESLAFLILAPKLREKIADELKHMRAGPPFLKDW
jgi:hypothetical protein